VIATATVGAAFGIRHKTAVRPRELSRFALEQEYQFINYPKNKLRFYGSNEKWNRLFSRMDSIVFDGSGHISMVHIGGSHVQGGFLTDRIRERFNELTFGQVSDRGFLFPYKLAGSNMSHSTECTWTGKWKGMRCSLGSDSTAWGMSGFEAITNDSVASFSIASHRPDSTYYPFNCIRVYSRSTANMDLVISDPALLASRNDFPALGYTEFKLNRDVAAVTCAVHRTDSREGEFALQGIELINGLPGVTYHSIGVNGASTRSYLRCIGFETQVNAIAPDLVVMAIGVNDANVPESEFDAAAYEARYDSIIQSFRQANPNACFVFITNNDTFYQQRHPNRNALKVREVMQILAAKYDGAVYDWLEIMGGLGSMRTWRDKGLAAKDLVHFSKTGYELEGDLFYLAFREAFGNYLQKSSAN
jgi:lysophospholipase L1-like esterase